METVGRRGRGKGLQKVWKVGKEVGYAHGMGDLYLTPYAEHLRCSLSVVTSHVSEIGLAEGCGNFINLVQSEFKVKMEEILSDEEGRDWPSPEGFNRRQETRLAPCPTTARVLSRLARVGQPCLCFSLMLALG